MGALDDLLASLTKSWTAPDQPGGAIVLFDRDGVSRSWCFGYADLSSRRRWTLDTPSRLASISKHVAAAATMRLELDGPLGCWLPELAKPLAETPLVRALTMTSGIPDLAETLTLCGVSWMSNIDAARLHGLSSRLDHLNFPSGTEISYSNTNFRLAQNIVERVTNRLFRDWLKENFFKPLDLTTFDLPEDESEYVPSLSVGYYELNGKLNIGKYGLHYSGSGGMVASAADLANWFAAMLRDEPPVKGLLARLGIAGKLENGVETAYARGLSIHMIDGTRVLGHGGSLPGYKNHVLVSPQHGQGIVVLSNREDTDAQSTAIELLAAALDLRHERKRPTKIPVGLYVEPTSGYTLELTDGARGPCATFLGAEDKLVEGGDGLWWSVSSHLPIRVDAASPDASAIRAAIGHGKWREWRRAETRGTGADIAGTYRCAALDAMQTIERFSGGHAIRFGGGPAPANWIKLEATLADCARAPTPFVGPWRSHPVLRFRRGSGGVEGYTLSSNRSRGWWFERVG